MEHSVRNGALHDELGARVRNLPGKNRAKNQSRNPPIPSVAIYLVETIHETVGMSV
jgi:hypothetical protein